MTPDTYVWSGKDNYWMDTITIGRITVLYAADEGLRGRNVLQSVVD